MTKTTKLLASTVEALDRLSNAVKDLAMTDPKSKLTYFEESPTMNQICFELFKELSGAQIAAHSALEAYADYRRENSDA